MARYMIEVSHPSDKLQCLRSVAVLLTSGSHFITNADWGCLDGNHKAWFIMEAGTKEEAMLVVPPEYRRNTVVSQLNKFKLSEVEEMLKHHTP